MAIEIIPKKAPRVPFWHNLLFYLSLILILGVISGYFVLNYFLKIAEEEIENLDKILTEEKTEEEIALEKKVFGYQEKIKNFSQLINARKLSLNFFDFLEKNCHPQVWLTQVSLTSDKSQAQIAGKAESFVALGQQLQIFKNEPLIKKIVLSNVFIGGEGKIEFSFDISLGPRMFSQLEILEPSQ